jgi:hypothetical protein
VLSKDYYLGIVFEAEIEDLTNLERYEIIENNTGCSSSVGRSKQEDKL